MALRSKFAVLQRATTALVSKSIHIGNASTQRIKITVPFTSRLFSVSSKQGRPQRSVLYLPGSNLKAIAKARTLPADMIVMDLEDAVAPDAKATARKQVVDSLAEGFKNHPVVVRANGLDTPWGVEDLSTLATAKGIQAIAIPKVENGATLIKANEILKKAGAPQDLEIWCMIETPIGIFNLQEICSTGTSDAAGKRLSALVKSPSLNLTLAATAFLSPALEQVMGTSDLTKDLRAKHTADRHPLLTSLQLTLLAARVWLAKLLIPTKPVLNASQWLASDAGDKRKICARLRAHRRPHRARRARRRTGCRAWTGCTWPSTTRPSSSSTAGWPPLPTTTTNPPPTHTRTHPACRPSLGAAPRAPPARPTARESLATSRARPSSSTRKRRGAGGRRRRPRQGAAGASSSTP